MAVLLTNTLLADDLGEGRGSRDVGRARGVLAGAAMEFRLATEEFLFSGAVGNAIPGRL